MRPVAQSYGEPVPGADRKLVITVGLIVLVFLLLALYFWNLQVIKHSRYQRLADNNRIRLVQMPATRGIITDRNGVILVDSAPCYCVAIIPEDVVGEPEALVVRMAEVLRRDPAEAIAAFYENDTGVPYRTIRIFEHLDSREVAQFEADQDLFPGAQLLVEPRRYYPFGEIASHVLGYVGEISRSQIESGQYPGAVKGDIIGKYAIEHYYDRYLRGRDGGRQVEVDARGREISILGVTEPSPGADVRLTLDIRIQKELEQALEGKRGGGVVLKADTGEVLAMVSEPSFDPNEFSLGISRERWADIIGDPGHPLQNKTVQGMYPPGSTFKVVTAIASLMEGSIDIDEILHCSGGYYFGRRVYRDWKLSGHGKVDLHKGIVESCDVYFYQAGERTGIDALARWASVLGLGHKTGVDLPGERDGLVPSSDWKIQTRNEPWFPGETLSASIGQGYVLVTPLQLANLYATIARRGIRMAPFLVNRIENSGGLELYRRDPMVSRELEIPSEIWENLVSALEGVVNEPHGTGRAARIRDIKVAGKTGTAQVVRMQEVQAEGDEIPYELRDHGWFVAFAPADDPKIAVAVVVEHGGHGSSSAAPIVARVMKKSLEFYPADTDKDPHAEDGG